MFSKKRGLSDVVTVTLIILLAIAAVVIVWAFVRSTLEDVGEEITGACITSAIKLVGTCASATGVVTARNDGRQDTIDSVKLVYYETVVANSAAQTRDTIGCTAMSPLAQATCSPIDPDGAGPLSAIPVPPPIRVGAAAVIGTTTCPVSESVICT